MADIMESFSKGLTTINVKASSFLESKKIQTYVSTLTAEIEILEKEIGSMVYEQWVQTTELSVQSIEPQLTAISQKKQIITEQTLAAEELAKKEQEILGNADTQKSDRIFCSNCGQIYNTAVKFCKKCGTKLQ